MERFPKSDKLEHVCYDIRGPVHKEALRLEEEGHKILKLNIGNPAPFGFEAPDEILVDVLRNLPSAQGYCDSKGLYSARKAIVQYYQSKDIRSVTVNDVYIGNGVSELITMAMQALLNDGDEVLIPMPDYPLWTAAATLAGGKAVHYLCDEQADWFPDVEDIKSKVTSRTKAIVVINPNNPTGTFIDGERLLRFLEQVPPQVAVVLDEAYTEYLAPEQRYDALAWVKRFPNLIVSRTFSKAYGLAGLRVGFAVAQPEMTDLMGRVRQPFNVNSAALAAAEAVLDDADYLTRSYQINCEGRALLVQAFEALGLEYVPSSGNFVLVKVGDAAGINDRLLRAGIIVRPVANYGLPEWLRVSVGLPEENRAFIDALTKILGK